MELRVLPECESFCISSAKKKLFRFNSEETRYIIISGTRPWKSACGNFPCDGPYRAASAGTQRCGWRWETPPMAVERESLWNLSRLGSLSLTDSSARSEKSWVINPLKIYCDSCVLAFSFYDNNPAPLIADESPLCDASHQTAVAQKWFLQDAQQKVVKLSWSCQDLNFCF